MFLLFLEASTIFCFWIFFLLQIAIGSRDGSTKLGPRVLNWFQNRRLPWLRRRRWCTSTLVQLSSHPRNLQPKRLRMTRHVGFQVIYMSCNRWNGYNNDQIQIFSRSRFAIAKRCPLLHYILTLDLLFRVVFKVRCWFGFGSSVLTKKLGVFTGNTFEWSWAAHGMGCCWKLRSGGMDHICGSSCFLLRDPHTWVINLIYPKHQGYYDWIWLWVVYMRFLIFLLHQRLLKVTVDAISLPLCEQQTNTPGDEQFQFHELNVCLNLYVVPSIPHNSWRFLSEAQVKTATRCWPETSRWYCLRSQPSVQTEPLGNQWDKNGSLRLFPMMGGFNWPIFIKSLIETEK